MMFHLKCETSYPNGSGPKWLRPVDIQQHNISRFIKRLVKEGLVKRKSCDCDGRGQYIKP
ncbi:MAG: hypothetical protein COB24_12995 [Hyphomicrobiales bacterium]|nr:MAG: hypothetical protein COB24_12995 [Hyphomicrobiales bacterium]